MNTHYDVIVMGVGAMGSAALHALAKRGYNVCGIEQFGIAHDKGSSHGESRLIRKAYFEHPDYVSLLHSSYDQWEQLEKRSKEKLFDKNGLLLAGEPDSTLIQGLKSCYSQHDLPHEKLNPTDAQKRWPNINLPEDVEIYYDPIAGYLHVENCVREFCRLAKQNGADIFNGEKVIRWQADSKNAVTATTDKRKITADRLIITCGAWASDALETLDLTLDIWRKVLYWYNTSDLKKFQPGSFPSFFIETDKGGFYGFPAISPEGVKIAEHYHKHSISHPDQLNRGVREREDTPVSNFVAQTFPLLHSSPHKSVVCMYTMSEDEHFIIDHHPDHKNVVIGTGFSGHGFKFSPVIGNILADLAINGSTEYPMDFLRLSRFKNR